MSAADTRQEIVEAADRLFYEQGFETTSFADIAAAVQLSRGNFYYHFKSKDEILDAVIARRLTTTRDMLEGWEAESADPAARIRSFIRILIVNQTKIMLYGCPVGTLCSELAKIDHRSKDEASRLFTLFRDWLTREFAALGRPDDADDLAMHILMRSQGVATLATALHDEAFVRREVDDMCAWLEAQRPDGTTNPDSAPTRQTVCQTVCQTI